MSEEKDKKHYKDDTPEEAQAREDLEHVVKLEEQIKSLESRLKEALVSCAEMSTPLGLLPINSIGMRKIVDEANRLKERVAYLSNLDMPLKDRIKELEANLKEAQMIHKQCLLRDAERLSQAEAENKGLASRDGNAKIQLCYNDGVNPFAKEDLKVVDFGVSDNIYIVESKRLSHLMDVAGRAIEVIEFIAVHTDHQNKVVDGKDVCIICEKVDGIIAEWDGIKK